MLDQSSYNQMPVCDLLNLLNKAHVVIERKRADRRRYKLTELIKSRKRWRLWFPPCRLFYPDLNTLDEAESDGQNMYYYHDYYWSEKKLVEQLFSLAEHTPETNNVFVCNQHLHTLLEVIKDGNKA